MKVRLQKVAFQSYGRCAHGGFDVRGDQDFLLVPDCPEVIRLFKGEEFRAMGQVVSYFETGQLRKRKLWGQVKVEGIENPVSLRFYPFYRPELGKVIQLRVRCNVFVAPEDFNDLPPIPHIDVFPEFPGNRYGVCEDFSALLSLT